MIKTISSYLLLTHRICRRNPKTVLGVFAVVTLVLIMGIFRLNFLFSVDDLIDADFKSYAPLQIVAQEFQDRSSVVLSIESEQPFDKKMICDVQSWILNMAKTENAELTQIQSTFGIRQAVIKDQKLTMDSPLHLDCQSSAPETEKIAAGFEFIKNSPWQGLLHTFENYAITINFLVRPPENNRIGNLNLGIVDRLKTSFYKRFPAFQKQSFFGGVTTYQSALKKAMDITQGLNLIMLVLTLFLFRFFLGTWKAGLVFNMTIFFALLWVYGLMGYLNLPIDVLSNSTGLILFVSCLEDFIFVAYGVKKFKWSVEKSLRYFLIPSFFTSVTTSVGFASLGTSDLGIIHRLGYIVAVAGMLEWVFVFLILPALLNTRARRWFYFSANQNWTIPLKQITNIHLNRPVTIGLIALVFLSLLGLSSLQVKDSPEAFFYDSHPINQTSQHLKKTRGWTNENSLLLANSNSNAENREILAQLKTHRVVANIESRYMVEDFLETQVQDTEKTAIVQLWEDSWFARRLISEGHVHRAIVYLNSMENDIIDDFIKFTENICQDRCQLVGTIISYSEFSGRVLNTLFESFLISIIQVIIIIFLLRGNLGLRETIYCIISSVWGPIALLAIFVWFKIPVFFISSMCAAVLVGLAGDNAIQFIFSSKKKSFATAVDQLSEASLILTIGNCLMLSLFFFSPIAPIAKLGGFMMLGILLCYFGDLVILKGLLRKK